VSSRPPPKKKASEKKQAIIPKKLAYEMTDAEINASVKQTWIVPSRNLRLKEKPSKTLRSHTSYYGQKIDDKVLRLNKKEA